MAKKEKEEEKDVGVDEHKEEHTAEVLVKQVLPKSEEPIELEGIPETTKEPVEEVLPVNIELEKVPETSEWKPRTALGKKVKKGEITSIGEILRMGIPIKEVEIVDTLLPDLQEEVLAVGRVQRVTDSGRRTKFRVVAAVGNGNGYIGLGYDKGKEAGPTIRKAIERAKLNIKEIKRGCGSWECGCGDPHTFPFKVTGKAGSVEITFYPTPMGIGLVSGEVSKKILALAGIKDVRSRTSGHTRTNINYAFATFNALLNTNYIKTSDDATSNLKIMSGSG